MIENDIHGVVTQRLWEKVSAFVNIWQQIQNKEICGTQSSPIMCDTELTLNSWMHIFKVQV